MSRRLTTGVLAVFYLLQATWLLHAGMDLLLPPVSQAAAADSCCTKTCGCPEDVKASVGCCCAKSAVAETPKPAPRPVSAIEAARCKGIDEAMTQAFTQPVVSGFASIAPPAVETSAVSFPEFSPVPTLTFTSIDKVPIARA
jgi:hypothetical protein